MAQEVIPQHIALIPDGNRRWAQLHKVDRLTGHKRGADTMYRVVDYLAERGIKYLTIWGFSVDNWKRDPGEVNDIFNLLKQWLDSHTAWAHSKGIRLRHLGRRLGLPENLREAIRRATELTIDNEGMTLNVAVNYTGKADIVDAVNRILHHGFGSTTITGELFDQFLSTAWMPDVDLVIRTAGEFRLSNFLLWQTAYSELYFSDALWPDFNEEEIEKALAAYSERQRRFGGD